MIPSPRRRQPLRSVPWSLGLGIALASLLCAAAARGADETFSDPFAYCKAVGTIDAPDARYTGAKMPEDLAKELRAKFASPVDSALESWVNNSFWRCMDGKLYACNTGANLPCQEKADLSRTPNAGMVDYCKSNPFTDHIPAFVTGRATVYLWSCTDAKPVVVRELTKPDARGFIANVWYQLTPP